MFGQALVFFRLQGSSDHAAAGYMLVAAVIWAAVPLAIDLGGGTETPFLFNAFWRFGGFVGGAWVLVANYSDLLRDRRVLQHVLNGTLGFSLAYGVIGKFEYALFAWSTQYVPISTTTVLYETWPLILVLSLYLRFRKDERYEKNVVNMVAMLLICLVGFVIITAGRGDFGGFRSYLGSAWFWGALIALGAAVLAGTHNAVVFGWGNDMGKRLHDMGLAGGRKDVDSMYMFGIVVGHCVSQLVSVVPSGAIGLFVGERWSWSTLGAATVGGMVATGVADNCFRKANAITTNLGVNAISYATPVVALVMLWLFSNTAWERWQLLVIGAAGIITANLLVNFEAEVRRGFKALIIALWCFGTFVYLRDDLFRLLGVKSWYWTLSGYFEALALAATVFTLLLAFRVARLVARTNAEENRTMMLFRKVEGLVQRGVLDPEVLDCILRIDDASGGHQDLVRSYERARELVAGARDPDLMVDVQRSLEETEIGLDAMARSKQQGIVLGELFALVIFGGMVAGFSVITRPDVTGWTLALVDLNAMLLPSVVVFLLVNVWDLQLERDKAILGVREVAGRNADFGLLFGDSADRGLNEWISVVLGVGVIVAFAVLLWLKWSADWVG